MQGNIFLGFFDQQQLYLKFHLLELEPGNVIYVWLNLLGSQSNTFWSLGPSENLMKSAFFCEGTYKPKTRHFQFFNILFKMHEKYV